MRLRVALPIAFLLLAAAFVALAPATLAGAWLSAATQGVLRLADASGTVWRGAGTVTDAAGTWRVPVAWRTSPLAALRGAAEVELAPQGHVTVDATGLALRDMHARLPAAALGALVPSTLAVTLGGDVALDAAAFRTDGRSGDGALNLRWRGARVVALAGALADFGTVDVRVTPRGSDLVAVIASEGGTLGITGDVVASNEQVVVNVTLTPTPALPPEIARILATLAAPDANGAVHLAWRGRRP